MEFSLDTGVSGYKAGEYLTKPFDVFGKIQKRAETKKLNLNIDSDNDGLTDNDEINVWYTDPNNPDTDGDGYLDGNEVEHGYDPLIPGSARLKNW